jgi:putative SOS response-associated peptidase YedK
MCYHVSVIDTLYDISIKMNRRVIHRDSPIFQTGYHLNGFQNVGIPVISNASRDAIDIYEWGLVPEWVDDSKAFRAKANTLNARAEEIFDKATYRNYWQNRCLVYVNGFFEPHYKQLTDKNHESWYIRPTTKSYFLMAGIYTVWKGIPTVTILTTKASPRMAFVHNDGERQPLLLEGAFAKAWVSQQLTKELFLEIANYNLPDESLEAYRTIDGIFNYRINTNVPEVLMPFNTPLSN